MKRPPFIGGFAPQDPTDGRGQGDWDTRYQDATARRAIRFEAFYLALHLFAVPVLLTLFLWRLPERWVAVEAELYEGFLVYLCAWLGGTLGGALFAMKWLYHTVAKGSWNRDRRLWRIFTPHLSGALAFAFVLIISSGFLTLFDEEAMQSTTLVLAVSFLVGYFSDTAIAKLAEVAESVFGPSKSAAGAAADGSEKASADAPRGDDSAAADEDR